MLRNKTLNFLPFLFLLLLCPSCGYHFGHGQVSNCYRTICIPYVEGDEKGLMTNALIRKFSQKGSLSYSSFGADLVLKVCLFPPRDETIGFIYAPPDKGDNFFKKLVVSNEARLTLAARINLIDRKTGECIYQGTDIESFIDYDYEPDLSNIDEHELSLGQLEMQNLAQDAAFYPLYEILAEKIVDYVSYSW